MSDNAFTVPGLEAGAGSEVVEILQRRLVGLIDMSLTLKHIHWNVVGPNFIGVHEMLDPQYQSVQLMVDAVAERIATLGGSPSGLAGAVVSQRDWPDYELGRDVVPSHLMALDSAYSGLIAGHRDAMARTGDLDPVTEDLLTGQTGELEQFQWFVRAHLETPSGQLVDGQVERDLASANGAT
jgi:starvation-inducible DNA-binding protein